MLGGGLVCVFGLVFGGAAFGESPLADPTRPGVSPAGEAKVRVEKADALTLNSTLVSPQRRVAVINGQVMQKGQMVAGATLVAVEPGFVLLHRGGEKIRLTLMTDTVKRAVEQVP